MTAVLGAVSGLEPLAALAMGCMVAAVAFSALTAYTSSRAVADGLDRLEASVEALRSRLDRLPRQESWAELIAAVKELREVSRLMHDELRRLRSRS